MMKSRSRARIIWKPVPTTASIAGTILAPGVCGAVTPLSLDHRARGLAERAADADDVAVDLRRGGERQIAAHRGDVGP